MIVVAAPDEQWLELTAPRPGVEWLRVQSAAEFEQHGNADAFFYLYEDLADVVFNDLSKPVIINLVDGTLTGKNLPPHIYRINGWSGFLARPVWEIAGIENDSIAAIFKPFSVKINFVKDEPGFINARVIAMIINEAYFALEEEVSSKTEIDTAMKLGTNYPFGPFEWAGKIGAGKILSLLQKLYVSDSRYKPSQLLITETSKQ